MTEVTETKNCDWLPLESIPTDGTDFLLWVTQENYCQEPKTRAVVTRVVDDMYDGLMFFDVPLKWKPINPPEEEIKC